MFPGRKCILDTACKKQITKMTKLKGDGHKIKTHTHTHQKAVALLNFAFMKLEVDTRLKKKTLVKNFTCK